MTRRFGAFGAGIADIQSPIYCYLLEDAVKSAAVGRLGGGD